VHQAPCNQPTVAYSVIGEAGLDADGQIGFLAGLTGVGAPAGRNFGLWSTQTANGTTALQLQKGAPSPFGGVISAISKPIFNSPNYGVFEGTVSGPGKNASNNKALYEATSSGTTYRFGLGDLLPLGTGQVVSAFQQTVESSNPFAGIATAVKLRVGPGGASAASDSAIVTLPHANAPGTLLKEGDFFDITSTYGQLSRVALNRNKGVFTCAVTGNPLYSQAVVTFNALPPMAPQSVAQRGAPAAGGFGFYGSFLGETVSSAGNVVFKGTYKLDPGFTPANSTAIWAKVGGVLTPVVRQGNVLPNQGNVTWSKFINYWAVEGQDTQTLILAQIKGLGITAANDIGLWLVQEDGSLLQLLREGDPTQDSTGAKIGSIQRVVANDLGTYAVLASLTNCPSSTNQALFTGKGTLGNATDLSALRRPTLKLRKGSLVNNDASATSIRSMAFASAGTDATGAGNKGLAQSIEAGGTLALKVQFNNGVTELLRGIP
jgi:hypothetical protein